MSMLLALAAAAALLAEEPAKQPAKEPGALEPWQKDLPLMSGDRWARLRIDIDERGRPLKCRIAETNLSDNMRFWACQAFLKDWHTEPLTRDGAPVAGTVERFLIMPGRARREAEKKARREHLRRQAAESR
jgi:hypothetical protein